MISTTHRYLSLRIVVVGDGAYLIEAWLAKANEGRGPANKGGVNCLPSLSPTT
jgi:hypothetical protein